MHIRGTNCLNQNVNGLFLYLTSCITSIQQKQMPLSRALLRAVLGTASEVTVGRRSLKGYLIPKFVFEVMVGAKQWKR